MRAIYDGALNATLTVDGRDRVRGIRPLELQDAEARTPRDAATAYLRQVAGTLKLAPGSLGRAEQRVSYWDPREAGVEYRLAEEKPMFDSTTVGFYQTALNTPVWQAGMAVTVKQGPSRVAGMVNTSHDDVDVRMPSADAIDRYRRLFGAGAPPDRTRRAGQAARGAMTSEEASATLSRLLGLRRKVAVSAAATALAPAAPRLIRGRFFVYRYVAAERTDAPESGHGHDGSQPLCGQGPVLPLPQTPPGIREGRHYLTAEITFALPVAEYPRMNWRMMVEVETGTVLYLRALTSGVNGLVFTYDPITSTGDPTKGPASTSAVLNPQRDTVVLQNLDIPVLSIQSLTGLYAALAHVSAPAVAAPTESDVDHFDDSAQYDVHSDDFAAVNAYYHTDRFFRLVEDLGFPIATYFNVTSFPVEVDHRGLGTAVNAQCVGDGLGGIAFAEYALAANTATPIGIACDWRVHLHELGGHGVLYEHVGTANFGFSHSAGDSFAVILNDPESAWHSGAPIDRFLLAPFVPSVPRRSDRDPAAGWGWGGALDFGSYSSEQILSTTLFRVYRSIGGDSTSVSRREFAARATAFLTLGAIGTLTPATNPGDPDGFADALYLADAVHWTSEGVFGGAYHKVIRWSFEVQGLYQGLGAPVPVISRGDPPPVDVYIDDGRAGEYQYLTVYWDTTTVWNRVTPDAGLTHEAPVLGESNYVYVRIRNRGTDPANNIVVRGFHCEPGAGLLWPDDLQPMTTAQLPAGSLPGGDVAETIVGPFEWTPVTNAYGHDCLIMVVTADGDPSNADAFTGAGGPVIPEWRLVPNDNNVAQRNVYPVPAFTGGGGLHAALDGAWFNVGNPGLRTARMTVKVRLPELLARRGWRLEFEGDAREFRLRPRERRRVVLKLTAGQPFTRAEVQALEDRDVLVSVFADEALIGGMTYRLDPEIARARYTPREDGTCCTDTAQALLKCLNVDATVKRVRVRRVTLDVDCE
jgi:hypothetical protein